MMSEGQLRIGRPRQIYVGSKERDYLHDKGDPDHPDSTSEASLEGEVAFDIDKYVKLRSYGEFTSPRQRRLSSAQAMPPPKSEDEERSEEKGARRVGDEEVDDTRRRDEEAEASGEGRRRSANGGEEPARSTEIGPKEGDVGEGHGEDDDDEEIPRHHQHQPRHRRRGSSSRSRSRSRPRRSRRESSRSPRGRRPRRSKDEEEYLRSKRRDREEESRREHNHHSRSRASRTVLIAQLGMDVTDRTVYVVMSKMAGKVRDVQIIRDGRSQRSKGIAYVEFDDQDSAIKALGIEPTSLWTKLGHGANIQPSQAEKNLNSTQSLVNMSGERFNECRLYVGGSANLVADLTEDDLRALFHPFGPLDFVDRHPRNQAEGGTYAFVQYGDAEHARSALKGLSGMMIGGKELKVGMATSAASAGLASTAVMGPNTDLDLVEDNEEGPSTHTGLLKDNLSRARLMQAMVREPIVEGSSLLMKSASRLPASNLASAASGAATGHGSRVLILRNLWAAGDQLMHEAGPEQFFKEIAADVKSEAKRFGTLVGCWLDEASENGDCWLKFTTGSAAAKCALGLHRRWFAGRQLVGVGGGRKGQACLA
ncbi:hypothetical protein FOL47_001478 [Perkinsus chesapeaki]|uniref:RRM domain-containing protein n=1 Tax=Perkinsus chesapeaki TaxID=330153 RepID=A0A7J6KSL9_PERCH|nr:hypothetical protein FOL47_001478 [Perkinsus chesapeaki]